MRHVTLISLVWLSAAATEAAFISAECSPALGGELTTVTLSIHLNNPGETLRGFDAQFDGAVRQANPFGALATIFTDNNVIFPNDPSVDVSQDSQFLFNSTDILSIGAEEEDGLLKGAISGIQSLGITETKIPFVQIATENPSEVSVRLAFDLGGAEAFIPFIGTLHGACVPEPTSGLLGSLASRPPQVQVKRTAAAGPTGKPCRLRRVERAIGKRGTVGRCGSILTRETVCPCGWRRLC